MELQKAVKAVSEHVFYRLKAKNLEVGEVDKRDLKKSIREKLNELVDEFEMNLSEVELEED